MLSPETTKDLGRVSALLAQEGFLPSEPRTLEQSGLSEALVEGLICKRLSSVGYESGRGVAQALCLPIGILEERCQKLRSRQLITHKGAAAANDYLYTLTDQGRQFTEHLIELCSYSGAAPVPLTDYLTSVDAQTITAESPKRAQLEKAFEDISIDPALFARLGPAVNSGAGLFLYGAPGNGKTTIAERVTLCFGQEIWIPRVLIAEGELIKLYDPAYHRAVAGGKRNQLLRETFDARWIKIRRPTVIVGGELTMDNLEIRHNPRTNVSEAPLQLKSNGGSLLIDDFGRQRVDAVELLNRWIVPLEKRYDFLTLGSGVKIQVPFDQLIIFSTNLEPKDLVDEAFLRRIPYKVNVPDPDEAEFHRLFALAAPTVGFTYLRDAVEYLLDKHYRPTNRRRRRCHPRDLLMQVHHYCTYHDAPLEMKPEYFDVVVEDYFTVVT
jgi:predicted ATPase with chaperone activity